MKIKKGILLFTMLLVIGTNLMSCNKSDNKYLESNNETKYYSTTIDGDKLYYAENDENVKSITQLVSDFLGVAVKTDYKNEEYLNEYDYYTNEIKAEAEEYGYKEQLKELITNYELVTNLIEHEINGIEFYKTNTIEHAKITCNYITTVTNSTEEYLQEVGIEKNIKYKRSMELNILKEDNQWKVVDYTVGKREKVN